MKKYNISTNLIQVIINLYTRQLMPSSSTAALVTGSKQRLESDKDVSRSSGLAKTILQGTVNGGRREGRQRKRWENNIREWTGLEFGRFHRAVENRGKWRNLVAKSSVVPQRLSRLRDR